MTLYRLSFESVNPIQYPQAYDPRTERARLRPEQVPEHWWSAVSRDTEDPWDQLRGLRRIRAEGELIRKIELWELSGPPEPTILLEKDP